jgi:hypothetical protein
VLAKLPAEEMKAFTQLWPDVTALLKKAEEKPMLSRPAVHLRSDARFGDIAVRHTDAFRA